VLVRVPPSGYPPMFPRNKRLSLETSGGFLTIFALRCRVPVQALTYRRRPSDHPFRKTFWNRLSKGLAIRNSLFERVAVVLGSARYPHVFWRSFGMPSAVLGFRCGNRCTRGAESTRTC